MPNTANINALLDLLQSIPDERFDMRNWYSESVDQHAGRFRTACLSQSDLNLMTRPECGTAACIAGWIGVLRRVVAGGFGWLSNAEWLGVTQEQGRAVFLYYGDLQYFGGVPRPDFSQYTRQRAINMLTHLRDTGEVDWDAPAPTSRPAWTPPAVIDLGPNALPEALTDLLNPKRNAPTREACEQAARRASEQLAWVHPSTSE